MAEDTPQTLSELGMVTLDTVRSDPRNANILPPEAYKKVRDHIAQTKNYPPLIVRELPTSSRFYDKKSGGVQLMYLDGHHRSRMLMQLGYEEAQMDNWGEVADDVAGLYLTSINYNTGEPDAMKLGALYHDISSTISLENISAIVPHDVSEVEQLIELQQESFMVTGYPTPNPEPQDEPDTAIHRRFTLYPKQDRPVAMALGHIMQSLEGNNKEGRALEMMSVDYLAGLDRNEFAALESQYLSELAGINEIDPLDREDDDD
jgi:hypothetical protein